MKARKPGAQLIHAESTNPLTSRLKYHCEATNQSLYKNQIGTYMPVGGAKTRVNKNEVKKMKKVVQDIGLSGMQLMGFKDKDYLKVYHNIGHSTFVVPDEKRASGSSACVDALI